MTYAALALRDATPQHIVAGLPSPAHSARRTATPADVTLHLAAHHWFVQFSPALAAKLGNFKAALFLGHALYWTRHLAESNQRMDGWFYMSAQRCQDVTGLTTREQGSVRRLLRELGLIEEKLAGVPATLHYRVNLPALVQWAGLPCTAPGNKVAALKAVDTWLNDSIRFYRPLADCAGSLAGGLYLSLLVQKQREWRGADGFSHVTQQRISELLAFGSKTQRNAREKLKAIGLLQERERGAWVRIDMDAIMKEIAPEWDGRDIKAEAKTQTQAGTAANMAQVTFTPAPAARTGAKRFPFTAPHITLPKQQTGLFSTAAALQAQPAGGTRRMFAAPQSLAPPPPSARASTLKAVRKEAGGRKSVSTKRQVAALSKLGRTMPEVRPEVCPLVMPPALDASLHKRASRTVAALDAAQQQMLLDELAGQMSVKNITNPIGYLHALVKKHKEGGFEPAMAEQVAADRERRARALAQRAQRESAAAAAHKKYSAQEIAAAKERLAALRSNMEASASALAINPRRRRMA
ncbi:MAG: hypothetical protein IKZ87_05510 [Actinomycetaceae bacterium]|nr:hypothetical protein [Actinomycetaceae bacterium]